MKKTIIILAAMTALASCQVCQDCTCTTYATGSSTPLSTTTVEACGKDEIKAIEGTTTSTSSGITVKQVCNCK